MARGIGNLYVSLGLNSTPFVGSLGDVIKKIDEFKARSAEADKSVKGTGSAMKSAGSEAQYLIAQLRGADQAVGMVSGSFEHLKGIIEATATGFLVLKGVEKAFDFIKDAIKDAAQEEVGMRKVADVIAATGGSAGKTAEEVEKMAAKFMESSTYTKDAIMDMEAKLLTFRGVSGETFTRASRDVLDMAYVMGEEPAKAAIQLGKALNDPIAGITALKKAGVTFSESQKEVIKSLVETGQAAKAQDIILTELENEFGGASAGAAETFSGKLTVLNNLWGEMKEQVGGAFVQSGSMNEILKIVKNSIIDLTDGIGQNKAGIQQLVKDGILFGVDALRIFGGIVGMTQAALTALGGVIEIVWGSLQILSGWAYEAGAGLVQAFSIALQPISLLAQGVDLIGSGLANIAGKEWTLDLGGKMKALTGEIDNASKSMMNLGVSIVGAGEKSIVNGAKMVMSVKDINDNYEKFGMTLRGIKGAIEAAPVSVDNTASKTTGHIPTDGIGGAAVDKAAISEWNSAATAWNSELERSVHLLGKMGDAALTVEDAQLRLDEATRAVTIAQQGDFSSTDKLKESKEKLATADKFLADAQSLLKSKTSEWDSVVKAGQTSTEKTIKLLGLNKESTISYSEAIQRLIKAHHDRVNAETDGFSTAEDVKKKLEEEKKAQDLVTDAIATQKAQWDSLAESIALVGVAYQTITGVSIKGLSSLQNAIKSFDKASTSSGDQKTLNTILGYAGIGTAIGQITGSKTISNVASSVGAGASLFTALGASGPVGAVIGGVAGLIGSLFGSDNGRAQRDDQRQKIYDSIIQSALSGGSESLKILKAGGYSYSGVANMADIYKGTDDRLFEDRGSGGLTQLQETISVLDQAGKTIKSFSTPTVLQNLETSRTLLEYSISKVGNLSQLTAAFWDQQIASVTGVTADKIGTMIEDAIDNSTSGAQAGQVFADTFEAQVIKSIKEMAISEAIQQSIMPMLSPVMTNIVQGMIDGTLKAGRMAELVNQAKSIADSISPIVSSLYDAFYTAGMPQNSIADTTTTAVDQITIPANTTASSTASTGLSGITSDSILSIVSNALSSSTSGVQAGRTFAETFEDQVIKSIKEMEISDAIQQSIMPVITPIMTSLVQGMTAGTLSSDQMAAMIAQVKSVTASVAPVVSQLYEAFNTSGLNTAAAAYTDASTPVTLEHRASGGPVVSGRSYIVGEHRPELFTPGVSGSITPYVPEGQMDYSGFLRELKNILSAAQATTVTIDGQEFSAWIERKRLQAESRISSGMSRTTQQVF